MQTFVLHAGCSSIRQRMRLLKQAVQGCATTDRLVYEARFARCLSIWQRKAFEAIALDPPSAQSIPFFGIEYNWKDVSGRSVRWSPCETIQMITTR